MPTPDPNPHRIPMNHEVELQPGGKRFVVEDDETVLDAALRQEINLPYGCQSGACGACRARVTSGRVHHRQTPRALSERERAAGYALLCQAQAETPLVLEAEEIAPGQPRRVRNLPARVARLQLLTHDVMAVHLKLPKSQPFQFRAGQYIDILLPEGRRRSFSIASPPAEPDVLELHVRRVPNGVFTQRVFEELKAKTILRIEGPLGNFYLRDTRRPAILVAGGTGFAPIKSMLEDAFAAVETRPLHLYWGVRARRDLYLHDLANTWVQSHPNFRFTPVLSAPDAQDCWQGRTGLVHQAILADYGRLDDFEVYMSGPPAMINAGKQSFTERGLDFDHLFFDAFEYAFEVWPEKEQPHPPNGV